jgi:uncharacterized damage-inducible protein DinB
LAKLSPVKGTLGIMSIRTFYSMWPQYNERITNVIAGMSDEQLAVKPSPDGWPVWATVGHTAGGRVYWLCTVIGEPGADTTPFVDPEDLGWEDDLDTPRHAAELVAALDSSWAIVDGCLDRWDESMMSDIIDRDFAGNQQQHTRSSILQRMFSHDAYHAGELSQTLGIHGLDQIDLWASG